MDIYNTPGHLVRRFQQIAVAVFHAETEKAGFDLTPVQFAALAAVDKNPGVDQATLAGLIAYDRTTIGGVVDRLVQKRMLQRQVSTSDRRARVLRATAEGSAVLRRIWPAVEEAQKAMLRGLTQQEAEQLMALLQKAIGAVNDLSRAPKRDAGTRSQEGG